LSAKYTDLIKLEHKKKALAEFIEKVVIAIVKHLVIAAVKAIVLTILCSIFPPLVPLVAIYYLLSALSASVDKDDNG
jgi:hypothetical protein